MPDPDLNAAFDSDLDPLPDADLEARLDADLEARLDADLESRLDRFVSESRTAEAASARSRRRWLRRASEESASLDGLLVELAEGRTPVLMATAAGEISGYIVQVGSDYCVISDGPASWVLLLTTVELVRADIGAGRSSVAPAGDRLVRSDVSFHELLTLWLEDRPQLVVFSGLGRRESGVLGWVGTDFLTLRPAPAGQVVYLPLASVLAVRNDG